MLRRILLLEDVAEEPYRLDRMLTHLLRSRWLDGVAGIAIGSLFGCGPADLLGAGAGPAGRARRRSCGSSASVTADPR